MFKLSQSAGGPTEETSRPSVPHNRSSNFGSDEDSAAFLAVTEDTKEVDFYKNPTILSRLLLNHNYASAVKRVKSHPEEASVWVAMKRNPFKREQHMRRYLRKDRSDRSFAGSVRSISTSQKSFYHVTKRQRNIMIDYSMRQLPIHMACGNLIRPSKPEEQKDLEKVIALLIVTYPEGCEQRDHDGKLPLHEAIWHNASTETISMMLMAYPSSLHERDKYGRSPLDLNRIRSGGDKERVKELLIRGVSFWEQARSQANARTKGKEEAQKQDESEGHDSSPSRASSIHSLRPDPTGELNPLVRDLSRQIKVTNKTSSTSTLSHQSSERGDDDSVVEPISWVKLEQRAVYLEQLLAGMYEKNYELGEAVEELTRERLQLQEELEWLRKRTNDGDDDESIAEENERLKEHISSMERALPETESASSKRSMSNGGSTESLERFTDETRDAEQIQYLREQNAALQEEVNELTAKIQEYESKVNRLEIIAGIIRQRDRAEETDADSALAVIPEDGSAERPVADKEGYSTSAKGEEAQEDLESLLASLRSNSRFATERFLAGKILLLEERLDEEMASREADVRANNQENSRLLMENEALQAEVGRLSCRNLIPGPSLKSIHETGSGQKEESSHRRQSNDTEGSSRTKFSEDPSTVFQTDNLDEILEGAAAMYGSNRSLHTTSSQTVVESMEADSEFEALLNEAFQLYGTKHSATSLLSTSTSKLGETTRQVNPIGQIRDEVERIENVYGKPVPLEVKMSLVSAVSSLSLGTKQSEDEDEDLDAFLQEAAKFYGKPIPPDLKTAMQGTSLVSMSGQNIVPSRQPDEGDDDIGKMFSEAERLYQKPIPKNVQTAVRDIVRSKSAKKGSDDTLPTSNLSPATSSSIDTETNEELLIIIREAERAYGKSLPADLRHALLTASISSGLSLRSLEETSITGDVRRDLNKDGLADESNEFGAASFRSEDETDEIEKIFGEAEKLYRKPIPSGVKVALRNAASSRTDFDGTAPELPNLTPASSGTLDPEDELEIIIRDAERAYGRSLPPDLKHALLTASISSGLSFQSLGGSSLQLDEDKVQNGPHASEDKDLEMIFEEATRLYQQPIPTGVKEVLRDAMSSSARLDGSAALASSVSGSKDNPSVDPYDELESIIAEAERAYGKSLSPGLKHALLTASISSWLSLRSLDESQLNEDDELEQIFNEAAILYRQPIPTGVKTVVRDAMSSKSGHPSELATPDLTPATSLSFSTYDELEGIIREAERAYGKSLSPDLKHALLTASISSRVSLRSMGESSRQLSRNDGLDDIPEGYTSEDESEEYPNETVEDDLDKMFKEAAILYRQPIPTDVKVVVREVVSSSPNREESTSSVEPNRDPTHQDSSTVDVEDELESIIREAEIAYGRSLPEDLKHALLTASISSGLSFRTFDASVAGQGKEGDDINHYGTATATPDAPPLSPGGTASDDLNEMFIEAAKQHSSHRSKIADRTIPVDIKGMNSSERSLQAASFASDNLDEIFSAAEKTNGRGETGTLSDSVELGSDVQPAVYKGASQNAHQQTIERGLSVSSDVQSYLPSGLSTSVRSPEKGQRGPPLVKVTSSKADSYRSRDDDLESIIREAEASYGMALPEELKRALRTASVTSGLSFRTNDLLEESTKLGSALDSESLEQSDEDDDDLERMFEQASYKVFHKGPVLAPVNVEEDNVEKLFEEAARIYDKPIPPELMTAMRDAVSPNDERVESSSESEYLESETESELESNLETSDSSVTSSADEELESIIREAERSKGAALSMELKHALLGEDSFQSNESESVSLESGSVEGSPKRNNGKAGKAVPPAAGLACDDLDDIFAQAAKTTSSRRMFHTKRNKSQRSSGRVSLETKDTASLLSETTENDSIEVMLDQYSRRVSRDSSSD